MVLDGHTGIPCRMSPPLTFSQSNTSWFLTLKLHRTYISLNTTFFLADVYIGKMYINVPKTQYSIFNKTVCMHTVHVIAHKATVC